MIAIFTRHKMGPEQAGAIRQDEEQMDCSDLAGQTIETIDQADAMVVEMLGRCAPEKGGLTAIYGVIPTIIRAALLRRSQGWGDYRHVVETWEAHTTNRAQEGKKPEFAFAGWMQTGAYRIW